MKKMYFLMIALALILSAQGCSSETKEQRAEKRCVDSSWAWVMSQRYVKNNLKSPSSAEFPALPNAAEHISGCTHVVVGDFEAQNGFGAMVRHRFSAKMTYNKQSDTWSGSDLNIQ